MAINPFINAFCLYNIKMENVAVSTVVLEILIRTLSLNLRVRHEKVFPISRNEEQGWKNSLIYWIGSSSRTSKNSKISGVFFLLSAFSLKAE